MPSSPRGETGLSGPIHHAEWAVVPYTPLPMGSHVPIIAVTSPDGATAFIDIRDRRYDRYRRYDRFGQGRTQSESDVDGLRARTQAREALEAEEEMEEELWEEAVAWEDEMPVVDWGIQGEVPAEFFGGGEDEDEDETEEEDKEEDKKEVEQETALMVWTGEQEEEGVEETATATAIEHSSGEQPEEQEEAVGEMSVVILGGQQQEEVVEEAAIEHWEGIGPSGEHLNGPFAAPRGVPSRRWSF